MLFVAMAAGLKMGRGVMYADGSGLAGAGQLSTTWTLKKRAAEKTVLSSLGASHDKST